MATVNSFKVKDKDESGSSIELPIQISSARVMDDYHGVTGLDKIILQLSNEISQGDNDLKTTITTLDRNNIAWERQHDGAVLRTSLDSGSTTNTRSLVIGNNNQIDTSVSNSLVLGVGNVAMASNSLVLGSYASTTQSTLLAIGNGNLGKGSNIFEVDGEQGREYIKGIGFYSDYFAPIGAQTSQLGTKENSFEIGYIDSLISTDINVTEVLKTPQITTTKIESFPEKDRIKLATSELWCSNQMQIYAGDFDSHDIEGNQPIIIHNAGPSSSGPFTPWFYPSQDGTGQLGREGNRWSAGCFNSLFADTLSVTTVETPRGGLVYSDGIVLYGDTIGDEVDSKKWLKLSVGYEEEKATTDERVYLYKVFARNAYMPNDQPVILFTVKSRFAGNSWTHSVEFPN